MTPVVALVEAGDTVTGATLTSRPAERLLINVEYEMTPTSGSINWAHESTWLESGTPTLMLAMAARYDAAPVGKVVTVTIEGLRDGGAKTCTFRGFGQGDKPMWKYEIKGCVLGDAADPLLAFSDDGSTVVAAYWSADGTPTAVALGGQTGKVLWSSSYPGAGEINSVSCSRDGARCSVATPTAIRIVARNGTLVVPPILTTDGSNFARLCPMGIFLISGDATAVLRKWNGTSYAVVQQWSAPATAGVTWSLADAAMSVNGGAMAAWSVAGPDGCLIGLAWSGTASSGDVIALHFDVYSMLSGKQFLTWAQAPSADSTSAAEPRVAFELNWAVLATGVAPGSGTSDSSLVVFDAINVTSPLQATSQLPVAFGWVDIDVVQETVYVVAAGQEVGDKPSAAGYVFTAPNPGYE
ncbi:uncharacterized protein AMSG_04098 [Thecamonas trahens ATCC 50062]|uniref:Uncharacterized protein n=1 Tax=Thecamonas trahens ATCC 50062 TaxID=461836 RepID=A0A0L0D986_THETB|nr:hypothetical protein AMSG_04098 [Thecamonas trahens ATCC 50062]KNC47868.1 hypothetical protein AMSG_04098 [Thecamonas trahens ATCC 50062]|eukprot:XP_013759346.1 hypothetical protein AMSG_04098 [Thecamonas trahens ATCC 50062]